MAVKTFDIDGIGTVQISKRSGSRSLRLSVSARGEVRISMPAWTPYQAGIEFARTKADWIRRHVPEKTAPLQAGHRVGKAHRMVFVSAAVDMPSSRLAGSEIRITRPYGMAMSHPAVQTVAKRAGIRALRNQAETLLPQRLRSIAVQHGFSYGSISVKLLKGRWGSCDNQQHIVLNLYLMQLPWELIDYVLLHELVHTRHLNHGEDFWREFLRCNPAAKSLRRQIRQYQPLLQPVIGQTR